MCETKVLAALADDDRNAALVIRVMVNLTIVMGLTQSKK